MPAIQLARLKIQVSELTTCFDNPREFKRRMHNLFEFYADRSYHPGQLGSPAPLLNVYHIPQPVQKEVVRQLSPFINTNRQAALNLVDMLWEEPNLEFRYTAIRILGEIDPVPEEDIVQRVESWLRPTTELRLIQAIFANGMARIRQENIDLYLSLIKGWLRAQDVFHKKMGLKAIRELVDDLSYENIPFLIRTVEPLIYSGANVLRPDLLEVIRSFAKRSPSETAAFLKQTLVVKTQNLNSAWIIRHSLEEFPLDLQPGLKTALRE
jgi:hypothetical protein